jgi:hypothetical protein
MFGTLVSCPGGLGFASAIYLLSWLKPLFLFVAIIQISAKMLNPSIKNKPKLLRLHGCRTFLNIVLSTETKNKAAHGNTSRQAMAAAFLFT